MATFTVIEPSPQIFPTASTMNYHLTDLIPSPGSNNADPLSGGGGSGGGTPGGSSSGTRVYGGA